MELTSTTLSISPLFKTFGASEYISKDQVQNSVQFLNHIPIIRLIKRSLLYSTIWCNNYVVMILMSTFSTENDDENDIKTMIDNEKSTKRNLLILI